MVEQKGGRATALILAGAVAKGAFEAGVLSVLAQHRVRFPITRVVGASAGALNASIYAAGIRAGRAEEAAQSLLRLWKEKADWHDVFSWSLVDLFHLRGAGTQGNVLQLMNGIVQGFYGGPRFPVELRIPLTYLTGKIGSIGQAPATTFENVRRFENEQFDTPAGWETVAKTALGSAALPFLFAPVDVPDVGLCVDGGLVNNTPIKYAMEGGIDQIIIVSAQPAVSAVPSSFEGLNLVGELIDILINERLYRDLHDAASVNEQIAQLEALVDEGRLTRAAADAVLQQFGWRHLELIQIRPLVALEGNAVAGFSHPQRRDEYIDQGVQRATEVMGQLQPIT